MDTDRRRTPLARHACRRSIATTRHTITKIICPQASQRHITQSGESSLANKPAIGVATATEGPAGLPALNVRNVLSGAAGTAVQIGRTDQLTFPEFRRPGQDSVHQ
jgi:hypothetical protein